MFSLVSRPAMVLGLSLSGLTTSHSAFPQISSSAMLMPKRLGANFGTGPLSFEPNYGQFAPGVNFASRVPGATVYLTGTEAVVVLGCKQSAEGNEGRTGGLLAGWLRREERASYRPPIIRMKLSGAQPAPAMEGRKKLAGVSNAFLGNNPTKWRTNIPTYAKVALREVYSGVDLVYYGNQGRLEYDFIVQPGGDPGQIGVSFEGAEAVQVDRRTGDLVLTMSFGEIRWERPKAYQEDGGIRRPIAAAYRLHSPRKVGFDLAAYDRGKVLIIDPVLTYATFFGGSAGETPTGIGVDSSGNVYIAGTAASRDLPVGSALQPQLAGATDVFLVKLSASGQVVYSTFLGGQNADTAAGLTVDALGNCYLTGSTDSPDFPLAKPLQKTKQGAKNAFVFKLNASGRVLDYSTFLGAGSERGQGIAVDANGNAFVVGTSGSAAFQANATFKRVTASSFPYDNAFAAKITADGSQLAYLAIFGGTGSTRAASIAVDSSGAVYVVGATSSDDFPMVNALNAQRGKMDDAFLAKLNAAGTALLYTTFLSNGPSGDWATGVAVDRSDDVYATATRWNPILECTIIGFYPVCNTFLGETGTLYKINSAGTAQSWSETFGGGYSVSRKETPGSVTMGGYSSTAVNAVAVDAEGNAYVAGSTDATLSGLYAVDPVPYGGGSMDAFVAKIPPSGIGRFFSTYLGGSDEDSGSAIAVSASGDIWVTGTTKSRDFPLQKPLQSGFAGTMQSMWIAKARSTDAPGGGCAISPPKNGASYSSRISPDSIASLFGGFFAKAVEIAASSTLPSSLGGTSVTIKDAKGTEQPTSLFCNRSAPYRWRSEGEG